jgi:ADP-heptose:LPS heptosyltransferase
MHLVTPCTKYNGYNGTPGQRYLMEAPSAEDQARRGYCAEVEPYNPTPIPLNLDQPPKRLLILRCGGYGDVLFLTPSLVELHRRFPGMEITVSTHQHTRDAIHSPKLNHVKLIDYPVHESLLCQYDAIVTGELIATRDMQHDASAYFAWTLGLVSEDVLHGKTAPTFDLKPVYDIAPNDLAQAWTDWPRNGTRPRIGIQAESSGKNRTYPVNLTAQLMETLIKEDHCDVFLFGVPSSKQSVQIPHFYPLPLLNPAPNYTESCAILGTMDALIAPDSSLCHIGGAIGLPVIALYGAFHWRQRVGYMPSVKPIQGFAKCGPCQWHLKHDHYFPPDQPCSQKGYCSAIAQITPDRIRKTLWRHIETTATLTDYV